MAKKLKLSLLFIFLMSSALYAEKNIKLISGRPVPIRIISEINSNIKEQDIIVIVDDDIKDESGEHTLILRGTPVKISSEIKKSKGVGKPGKIKLNFISTKSIDGQTVRLLGNNYKEGENRRGMAIGIAAGGCCFLALPCLFCLLIKGGEAIIPGNTIITNVITSDIISIEVKEPVDKKISQITI